MESVANTEVKEISKVFYRVALIGNPNAGKTSLFNHLTGLNQKVGNFPGVTVDKKTGVMTSPEGKVCHIIDLPGTYSIYPRSLDEKVVFDSLSDRQGNIDLAVVVVDASNLKRNLLLLTQIKDLGLPTIVVLTMRDLQEKHGEKLNIVQLERKLGSRIIPVNGRTGEGVDALKSLFDKDIDFENKTFFDVNEYANEFTVGIKEKFNIENDYLAYQYGHQYQSLPKLSPSEKLYVEKLVDSTGFDTKVLQSKETIKRYQLISDILKTCLSQRKESEPLRSFTHKLDKIFTHKVYGYAVFFVLLTLIFQAMFEWSSVPMDWIDGMFATLSEKVAEWLPDGPLNNLLTEGIIPGIGGIVIFIPQITILFAFITILEESGYMARVVFLMDKIMRKFGLNGRSIVPLVSGVACAIPAVMASRSIENSRDRLITILVVPLMSCSARLPVYAILIALVVPEQKVLGVFNVQGLVLMGLYLLGFVAALVFAAIFRKFLKVKERSFLVMELPNYRVPRWKNVGVTVYEKGQTFVFEAGKIILAISIILWVLASYGPGDKLENAEKYVTEQVENKGLDENQIEDKVNSYKLEHSYAGQLGKFIEPVIRPLGYDWKIGIALLTSFAAREVFVGTMATIYSIGSKAEDDGTIRDRLRSEVNPKTGEPVYTKAVAFSLLIFYAFAMQCMSTLAIVKRETKSWKWPAFQMVYLTLLAYGSAFVVYHIFS
ncbi:ferrous iron transport protein B [Aureibacter tunicatorum]|uniref:Ferrous iron transport protein B n=1 Tax=Aureibacter tunicatorum TaxID=866807 RepID=A0AAE4BRB8_9BACT|nr:ferrous iron transport protein B [Aureibacter tunicatorum]MDR6237087.1 ferrous iron transport protein B [Aureibacter tunicatorum]BDD06079.1 ferrous iron transport protein B [Aureibacter tunicatorum]